jgi:ABC-type dipeptide/oligopeptide/nickel transport system permease subunit
MLRTSLSAANVPSRSRSRRIVLRHTFESLWFAFTRNKTALAGLFLLVAIVCAAIVAPLLTSVNPIDQDVLSRHQGPSAEHLLGTDQFGRDIFARLLYGARVTLWIALSANLLAMALGALIGLLAGYHGGRFDTVVMQVMDALLALPTLILGLSSGMAVAVLLPLTFPMAPLHGMVFLTSIYVSVTYGGAITAILLNTPGAPENSVTALDGYPMSR